METIYQTIVKDCGCDVGAFDKKNFLITFGHKTLVTLKDFCYFIDITHLKKKQETMVVPASFCLRCFYIDGMHLGKITEFFTRKLIRKNVINILKRTKCHQ